MKKVLIVTYYWPPSGGIGVLRCLKLAKYLHKFNWQPIIFTALGAEYPTHDLTNFKDVDDSWEVLKQKIWEPYTLFKLFTGRKKDKDVSNYMNVNQKKSNFKEDFAMWIRSNFFIPDARAFWVNPSIKKISKYLSNNKIDAILSCGPPHTNSLIASRISQKFNIPHLADFQDPWTQIDYFSKLKLMKRSLKKHKNLEIEVLKNASFVSIVSDQWSKDIKEIYPVNTSVIPWGFDPDDYKNITTNIEDEKFTIIHSGLVGKDRNPSTFLSVLNKIADENESFKNSVDLKLFGFVDLEVKNELTKIDKHNLVSIIPPVNRTEILQHLSSSSIQLLLLNKQANAVGRIPGKLFEYLAIRKPILALGETKGDSSDIIENANAGIYSDYEDFDKMKKFITDSYLLFINNSNKTAFLNSKIDQYSNIETTKKFASLLDQITN